VVLLACVHLALFLALSLYPGNPSPFISKASRRVSSYFLSVQLSQPYTLLHATLALSLVVSSLELTAAKIANSVRRTSVTSASFILCSKLTRDKHTQQQHAAVRSREKCVEIRRLLLLSLLIHTFRGKLNVNNTDVENDVIKTRSVRYSTLPGCK